LLNRKLGQELLQIVATLTIGDFFEQILQFLAHVFHLARLAFIREASLYRPQPVRRPDNSLFDNLAHFLHLTPATSTRLP
jgi:hypothetical protein